MCISVLLVVLVIFTVLHMFGLTEAAGDETLEFIDKTGGILLLVMATEKQNSEICVESCKMRCL